MKATDSALNAYQTGRTLDNLRKAEYGLYGITSANGLSEYVTGIDMFGNELSEEQRERSLNEALAFLGGNVAGVGLRKVNPTVSLGHKNVQKVPEGSIESVKLSPSNYPNPDPPMSAPPVKYEPKKIEEVIRMRQGKGPTTKMTHGDKNIEAHHRQQVPVKKGGILDELEQKNHRGEGNHTRHDKPSQLTPSQRAKEIREHYKERGKEYILPGEGI